jgi:hypothetical protein
MKRLLIAVLLLLSACHANNSPLYLISDSVSGKYGYINSKRDTIIPLGKYQFSFTDTFKNLAFVEKKGQGIVAINRNEEVLFAPYIFDNGPDYVVEGYFRIIDKHKIGFADTNGVITIKPQFGCAFPFSNGIAKVSNDCRTLKSDPEHSLWESDHWFYIDKLGKRVK